MYRALVSFSGVISMAQGEEREITDKATIKDLMKAGYIEEVKSTDTKTLKKEIDDLKTLNETLTKELEKANATIETLNAEIDSLKTTDESSVDTSDNEGADDENKNTDEEGQEGSSSDGVKDNENLENK